MSIANETCDFCHSQSPTAVCLCQFPLLKTCETCQVKHSETAAELGFHYRVPLIALTVITTKAEWFRRSKDIPQTRFAQSVLNSSLQELDALEAKVQTAYATQASCLQQLRDEYLHVIQSMKVRAKEDFAEVARESQAHLLDFNFTSLHPTAQWLNYFKRPTSEVKELFGGEVQAGSEEALRCVFQFKPWTLLESLSDGQYWCVKGVREDMDSQAEPAVTGSQSQSETELAIKSNAHALESLKREKEALQEELQRKTQASQQQFLKAVSKINELTRQLESTQTELSRLRSEPRNLELQEHYQTNPIFAQTTRAVYVRNELPARLVLRRILSKK